MFQDKNVKEIDINVIKKLKEHAKKYDEAIDKKMFLKNVCAYEQKIILFNSHRPYEVLNYLDELDLKSSRLVISELSKEEITKMLELFTSEDKKNFYNTFSSFEVVNNFITHDKNSFEYIKDLSFDRKLELLNSSNEDTIQASSELYVSMSPDEKNVAMESIDSPEASVVLNEVNEDIQSFHLDESSEQSSILINETPNISIEKINIEEKISENQLGDQNNNTNIDELNTEKQGNELPQPEEDIENLEKHSIVGNGERNISIVSDPTIVEQFEQVKNISEQFEIENLKNQIVNSLEEETVKQI